jgi:hypothetical protein
MGRRAEKRHPDAAASSPPDADACAVPLAVFSPAAAPAALTAQWLAAYPRHIFQITLDSDLL